MIPRRHSLIIAIAFIVLAVIVYSMIGCARPLPPSTKMPSGMTAPAPPGWVDFCIRHPEDPCCPKDGGRK